MQGFPEIWALVHDQDLKMVILDKSAYCTRRRLILLNDTAINLAKRKFMLIRVKNTYLHNTGEWEFNVDLNL